MHSTEEDVNVTVINWVFFYVCCRPMLLASLHFGMRACCLVYAQNVKLSRVVHDHRDS